MASLPGLDVPVSSLAANVENAMVALYNLQTSLINRSGTAAVGGVFTELRKGLKIQWENDRVYLQRCHAFGADVFILKDALGTENAEDLMEFLLGMVDSAEELKNLSSQLKSTAVSEAFSKVNSLQKSVSDPSTSVTPRASSTRAWLNIRNPDLKAFADANIASMHPDGSKSLNELDDALTAINSNIDAMSQFWVSTSEGCRSFVSDDRPHVTAEDVNQITTGWTRYQHAIEDAIVSITKTNDAILVEAIGAAQGCQVRNKGWTAIINWLMAYIGTKHK